MKLTNAAEDDGVLVFTVLNGATNYCWCENNENSQLCNVGTYIVTYIAIKPPEGDKMSKRLQEMRTPFILQFYLKITKNNSIINLRFTQTIDQQWMAIYYVRCPTVS